METLEAQRNSAERLPVSFSADGWGFGAEVLGSCGKKERSKAFFWREGIGDAKIPA